MVVRANKYDANIGGHLATYASLATLLEVGYNHFFRGSYPDPDGDASCPAISCTSRVTLRPACMRARFSKAG